MTKHTKGPWRVTGPNIRAGDALVAVVQNHWANKKTPEEEKAANAVLIAAAPELLEMLEKLLPCISNNPEFWWEEKAIRFLIAKATHNEDLTGK